MPFVSKRQQRFMFAKHPRIAKKMAKDMKDKHRSIKALPETTKEASLMEPIEKFAHFYGEAMEKVAEKKDNFSVPLGLKDTLLASNRILRAGDKGMGKLVVSKKGLKRRYKAGGKGALVAGGAGIPIGALLGALVGKGSRGASAAVGGGLGGLLGALGGWDVGIMRSDLKHMRDKGLKSKWHGFTSKATPAAHRKYIAAYKKKK